MPRLTVQLVNTMHLLAVFPQAYATNCYLTTTQQANRLLQVLC